MKTLKRVVAAVILAAIGSGAMASINFESPYFFVSEADARKGVPFILNGGKDGDSSYISVRIYEWKQSEEMSDQLVPAVDVAAFPQLVRADPNTRVSVRLKWNPTGVTAKETYYRIVMEEFDRPDQTNNEDGQAAFGLKVRPRVSIPFVIYGTNAIAPAQLTAKPSAALANAPVNQEDAASASFIISNGGETYAKLFEFRAADGTVYPLSGYVLPGATMRVAVPGLGSFKKGAFLYASGRDEHVRKSDVLLRTAAVD